MHSFRRFSVATAILVAVALFWSPAIASAHPADEYLQSAYVTLTTTGVAIRLDLTAGPLVAPDVIALLDSDSNGEVDSAEGAAYAEQVLNDLVVTVDGDPVPLQVDSISIPDLLLIEAGGGIITIHLTTSVASGDGTHVLVFQNLHDPVKSVYQASTLLPQEETLTIGDIEHDATQQGLTIAYDVTPVASVQTTLASTTTTQATVITDTTSTSGVAPLVAALSGAESNPWWVLLGIAAVLGALHALTPGHGKTLVAAYLVGSRGTPKHAILLGGTVTLTHTASVFGIGLLVLFIGQSIPTNTLTTGLEVGAGALVLLMGARLLWERGRAVLRGDTEHGHDHTHAHDHFDDGHSHSHDHSQRVGVGNLMMLGVSGGLIPCPEALGVMLVAISLGRVWEGLGLITAFSLGLAATIIALGLVLVMAGNRVRGAGILTHAWIRFLPLGSAVLITLLGGAMTLRGVLAAFGVAG